MKGMGYTSKSRLQLSSEIRKAELDQTVTNSDIVSLPARLTQIPGELVSMPTELFLHAKPTFILINTDRPAHQRTRSCQCPEGPGIIHRGATGLVSFLKNHPVRQSVCAIGALLVAVVPRHYRCSWQRLTITIAIAPRNFRDQKSRQVSSAAQQCLPTKPHTRELSFGTSARGLISSKKGTYHIFAIS